MSLPWLTAESRWQAICAELLLDRAENEQVRLVWPLSRARREPGSTLAQATALNGIGEVMSRGRRVGQLLELARWFLDNPTELDNLD